MIKFNMLFNVILILLTFIVGIFVISSITKTDVGGPTTIYPVETLGLDDEGNDDDDDDEYDYSLAERQRVDLHLYGSDTLETVTISTVAVLNDDTEPSLWRIKNEEESSRISKLSEQQLYITYQGKNVLSTDELIYDYIHFNAVCTGPDKRQQLLFSMVRGGTANGDIQDMLFVYIDPISNTFQYNVVERRYLSDVCDMDSAQANEAEQAQLLAEINTIHEQLRPSMDDTDVASYLFSEHALPIRQFSKDQFESILTEFKRFIPVEIDMEEVIESDEYIEEYPDFYQADFMINDIVEDEHWKVVEILYLQLDASWGVLAVENKSTGDWTSFYTVSEGDSKRYLYLDDELELVDGELRGDFKPYSEQRVAVSLDDFTVQQTFEYNFEDYPIESFYEGPIAELNTQSSEFAALFRTRIRQQLEQGVDFAGHYSLMMAGCGTECQAIAITDVITGDVVAETVSRAGAEYYEDSQLLILDGDEYCLSTDICSPSYYLMISGQLLELD